MKRVYVGYIRKEDIPKWDRGLSKEEKKDWGGWVTMVMSMTKKNATDSRCKARITIETIKDGKK